VDYSDLVFAVRVRMCIYIIWNTMRCPPGVTDAGGAVQLDRTGVFGDPAFVLFDLDVTSQCRNPERVIPPVFEFF